MLICSAMRLRPAAISALVALCTAAQTPASARPNIVFAIADDWGWPHAGAYGDEGVKTPTFDRLAMEGVLVENAYISSPSCTPSRGAIITGQQFWRLGPAGNLWSVWPSTFPEYPRMFAGEGYFVGSYRKGWGPGTAILKVAELVGGIGLGTGFRSANRSVAGRASPALWGWGSALAGDPGSWCRRAALRPAGRPAAWACIAASRSWCRRAALRPAGAGAAGWELVGGRAVMQGWARGTGPAAVPRAASPATRSSAGNRRTWSGSARPGRNRAA